MKTKKLYIIWLVLYILCAIFGFIQQRNAFLHILFSLLAIAFYIPGGVLLCRGIANTDKKLLRQLRIISACVLVLTLLVIVVTVLSVLAGDGVGMVLHILLGLVSTPMFCFYWRGLGLFLWACLLIASFPCLWKK